LISATYSNLENHPRLLRLTQPRGTKKISLDSKSGLPIVKEMDVQKEPVVSDSDETDDEDGPGELHARFDLI
jgi:protein LTV1